MRLSPSHRNHPAITPHFLCWSLQSSSLGKRKAKGSEKQTTLLRTACETGDSPEHQTVLSPALAGGFSPSLHTSLDRYVMTPPNARTVSMKPTLPAGALSLGTSAHLYTLVFSSSYVPSYRGDTGGKIHPGDGISEQDPQWDRMQQEPGGRGEPQHSGFVRQARRQGM